MKKDLPPSTDEDKCKENRDVSPEVLRRLRAKKGVGVLEAAAGIGACRAALSNWERGKAQPQTKWVKALADYYGVAVEDLQREATTETTANGKDGGPEVMNRLLLEQITQVSKRVDDYTAACMKRGEAFDTRLNALNDWVNRIPLEVGERYRQIEDKLAELSKRITSLEQSQIWHRNHAKKTDGRGEKR